MSDEYRDFDREDCPSCGGTGVLERDEDDQDYPEDDECPDCEGTGWLPL